MQHNEPFWVVWNPNGHSPTHKHDAIEKASREAERLARTNPGQTFVVLESVSAMVVDNLHRTNLRPEPPFEPPF